MSPPSDQWGWYRKLCTASTSATMSIPRANLVANDYRSVP
jgi:hypothetical protein